MANNNSMDKVIEQGEEFLRGIEAQPAYGVPPQALYGVEKPNSQGIIFGIIKNLIIPLIFVIGMIVYLKKGKSKIIKIILISAFIIMLMMFISSLF